MSHDEQEIRDLVATWMQATREGDSAAVLGLMADDAVFLVPGQPPFGKAQFAEAAKQQAQSKMTFDGHSEIEELQVHGHWAFMRSRLTVRASQPGEPRATTRSGYTLTILVKHEGRWRLARDANLLVEQPDAAG